MNFTDFADPQTSTEVDICGFEWNFVNQVVELWNRAMNINLIFLEDPVDDSSFFGFLSYTYKTHHF